MTSETTYSTAVIPPELLKLILKGDLSPVNLRTVETEIGAYFGLQPEKFGGILFHPDGRGPEKPYFFPDDKDLVPVTQAVARIGVQCHYWEMMSEAIKSGAVALAEADAMSILVVNIESPHNLHKVLGRNQLLFGLALNLGLIQGRVEVTFNQDIVDRIAQRSGQSAAEHPARVDLVNYGGDADFWGVDENSIFPMSVQVNRPSTPSERRRAIVERHELGLDEALVQKTWDSWRNFDQAKDRVFHLAVEQLLLETRFHPVVQDVLTQAYKKGGYFNHGAKLGRTLILGGVVDNEILDAVWPLVTDQLQALLFRDYSQPVFAAADGLAANLSFMYQTAKKFCRSVYPY